MSARSLPPPPSFDDAEVASLVQIAARWSRLAHPDVVRTVGRAVFPTVRANRERGERLSVDTSSGVLLDDNTTARWALLWTHGYAATGHPPGWTFAHVYAVSGDPAAYTHPANIVLLPDFLGGLTDKNGPLAPYLRYHVEAVYGLAPFDGRRTAKPPKFDDIAWTYLDAIPDPLGFVRGQLARLDNARVRALRAHMAMASDE